MIEILHKNVAGLYVYDLIISPYTASELSRPELRVKRELLQMQGQHLRRLLQCESSRCFHLPEYVNTSMKKYNARLRSQR